jgi:hypothetical protein
VGQQAAIQNMTTLHLGKLIGRSPLRRGLLFVPVALAGFAFSQTVQGVVPAPDGGYPGFNTAEGQNALFSLTTGERNTAIGGYSLFRNRIGNSNTGVGLNALRSNTSGSQNVAIGDSASLFSTTGSYNTAVGQSALAFSISSYNTAVGAFALYSNTSGSGNTASGLQSLTWNRTGSFNTAHGFNALDGNMVGSGNTAVGANALFFSTSNNNTAVGSGAGHSITGGGGNVCIGEGVVGVAGAINTTWIRNVYASTASGRAVYVNSDNKLGTLASSRRYKDEIKPMDKVSEAILALKPVTFRYKQEIDPIATPQFGLIAEEVAEKNPDLVTRDADGKPETVRYEAVNAMLLNEFLKQHRVVQEQNHRIRQQEATIVGLKSTVAQQKKDFRAIAAKQQQEIQDLTASMKEQASQIQKVSAQLDLSKTASQIVHDNP